MPHPFELMKYDQLSLWGKLEWARKLSGARRVLEGLDLEVPYVLTMAYERLMEEYRTELDRSGERG
jgi:hypothetical protein